VKILFFSPYFYPYISGITISPKRILDHLSKKNKITVLTFINPLRASQLNIIRMPYLFKISKGFISPQSIFYFLNKIIKCDLVILNQPNFEGLFLAIIAKMFKKKIISIFHCQVFLEGNLLIKIINFALNTSMKMQLYLSDKIVVYTKDYVDSFPYFKKLVNKTLEILPPIEKSFVDKNFLNKLLGLKKIISGSVMRAESQMKKELNTLYNRLIDCTPLFLLAHLEKKLLEKIIIIKKLSVC